MESRIHMRAVALVASALLALTLNPVLPGQAAAPGAAPPSTRSSTTSSEQSTPDGGDARLTEITDGIPGHDLSRSVRDSDAAADDDPSTVATTLLPDEGVDKQVQREAEDGPVDVIVRLREQADLPELTEAAVAAGTTAAVERREELADRGLAAATVNQRATRAAENTRSRTVVEALRTVSRDARTDVQDTLADLREAGHLKNLRPYWVFAGFAATVDRAALAELADHPAVASVSADETIRLPEMAPESAPKLPTWGLERVRATDVWAEYDDRGEGVVVGLMDSGVDGDHPALSARWRGKNGDPEKSWFVATSEDYPEPGDGFGHGTHVAGTMVGGPPGEVVGVAPEATWIAAKIFNDVGGASTSGIHSAFQWMLAPGGDPTARPDLVNNSWGSAATYNTEFWADVDAWIAAGIVPIFANGNDGPAPATVGSPGSFPQSFAVGATDINDVTAGFSSRGPVTWDGETLTKPQISAPGHHIVSAWPTDLGFGEYVDISGTSMATPHVSGVAALLLAANPSLSVDQVESVLQATARQEPHMGQLPDNEYGHGIVDAYAAVTRASSTGTVSGTVTTHGNRPVAGAQLVVKGVPWTATTATDDGDFQIVVPSGTHTIEVTAPGQQTTRVQVTVAPGAGLLRDIRMKPAKEQAVSGTVTADGGGPVQDAEITLTGSGAGPAYTDGAGRYSLTVPAGEYQVRVRATGYELWSRDVTVTRKTRLDVSLTPLSTATREDWPEYQNTPAHTGLSGDAVAPATLRRQWSVDTGPGIIFSSPVVADGMVYVGTTDGELEARDLETGELVWVHDVGDQLRGSPAVADGTVVIGGGLDGGIVALDATTGEERWQVDTPGQLAVYTQPTVIGDTVYANTGPSETKDSVLAIDLATGSVLWNTPVAAGVFNGPASDGARLFVTSADERSVTALDRTTGEKLWTTTRDGESFYGAASVIDGIVYANSTSDASWDGAVLALDAADGSVLWEQPDHGDGQGSTPAVFGDVVITGTHANGAVVAYDRETGEVVWRHHDTGPVSSSLMTTSDGYVIGGSQIDSVVFALDAATGKRVWTDDVGANVTSSGAYADGTYVTADTSGQLYAYRTTGSVTGSVTGPDGPLAATVEVVETGEAVETDPETGSFEISHRPGDYELRASAYGYVAGSHSVTVTAGRSSSVDFSLEPAGTGSLSGTVVDAAGDPLADATVTLEGTPLDPATTAADGGFNFADVAAGDYVLKVEKAGYQTHTGNVAITDGGVETVSVTLDRYRVAVTGDYEGIMVATLERLGYPADVTTYDEVIADPDRYELVVANGADDEPADGVLQSFIDATDAAGISVIWLDQWSIGYGSIGHLSDQTGDPSEVVTQFGGSGRVSVVPTVEHPLTEGLPLDTRVQVLAENSDWAAFTGYSGTTVAGLHVDGGGDVGSAIAYRPRSLESTHVLLSTFAAAPWGGPEDGWLPVVDDIIGNAVDYALEVEYGRVSGTVSDDTGAPVEDATVVVVGTDQRVTTAADGSYELLLDPGEYTLRFRAPGLVRVEQDVTVTGGDTVDLDVTLPAAGIGSVTGTVTGDDGSPVVGATVRLQGLSGAETTTGSDGGYTIADVPAETYTLEAVAPGHLTATREVEVTDGGATTVDVQLHSAPRVGVLGDYQGQLATLLAAGEMTSQEIGWSDTAALADLDVVVVNDPATPTAAQFERFLAAMDEHGVSGVFGDGYFSSDGGVRFLRQFTGNPSEERIRVTDVGDIRFRARDPQHPLFAGLGSEPQVLLHDSFTTAIPGYTGFPLADLVSEDNGVEGVAATYQPRTSHSIHLLLGGLTAGLLLDTEDDWTADGRQLFRNAVLFAADPALGTVSGTVTDADGAPVPSQVTVDGTEQRVEVRKDGSYALHLPPGTWQVRWSGFGYAAQTEEVTVEAGQVVERDVSLAAAPDAGSVSGTVTADGEPVAGATVRLLGVPRETTTGADGSYTLPLVEPGEHRMDVTSSAHLRYRDELTVEAGQAVTRNIELRATARVGVIDDYQQAMSNWLTHWGYTPQPLAWDDTSALADLDLVIANMASFSGQDPGREGLMEFEQAALRAGISVVWLDQFGRGSFRYLSDYTGDPGGHGEDRSDGPVTATLTETDHPIADGLPATFPLVADNNEYSWFEDFSGTTLATVSSDTVSGAGLVGERPRGASGIDVVVGTLSMSTYGRPSYDEVTGDAWSPEAERLLRNAVRYALDAPPAGGNVDGQLTGADGPLAGTVTVVETGRTYRVGTDGGFLIGLPPGTWTLRGEAARYAAGEITVEVSVGDTLAAELPLEPLASGTVTGTVTDDTGAPAAGLTVRLQGTDFTTTTDDDGGFAFTGVPAGDYVVTASGEGWQAARAQVTVTAGQTVAVDLVVGPTVPVALVGDYVGSLRDLLEGDGYTVTDYSTSELDELAAAVGDYEVVILNRGASSTSLPAFGALLDAAAAEGVSVVFGSQYGGDAIESLRRLRNDPESVESDFVPSPVSYVPQAQHPIFAGFPVGEPITILDDPEQTGDNQQYSVFDGYSGMTLAGIRADGDGSDLGSGVGVRYSSRTSVEVLLASLTAGSYGRPGREWTPAAERIYLQAIAFAATAERGEITGTVTGDGSPVADAKVLVEGGPQPQRTTTDDTGRFAVGVPDGTYTVTVSATGFTDQSQEVTVADNAVETADFDLEPLPRGELTGQVTNSDGVAVAGATVSGHGVEDWEATTAADGRFRATGLLDGAYEVTVTAPGHLEREVSIDYVGPTMSLDVELTRIDVGVLGDVDQQLVEFLREEDVAAGPLEWTTDLDLTGYEVVVVNGDGGDPVTEAEFDELEAEARRSGTGLVWGGTWGSEGGIRILDDHTDRVEIGAHGFGDGPVRLTDFARRSRLLEGMEEPARILVDGGYWSTIADYRGKRQATQRVTRSDGTVATGIGVTWGRTWDKEVEVLLSSMAVTGAVGPELGWTPAGKQLFLNAVEFAREP